MQFDINRDLLLKSLNFVQGVVEKKNTLPILSNVLLNLKGNKLEIVATDLDIVFHDEISELKVILLVINPFKGPMRKYDINDIINYRNKNAFSKIILPAFSFKEFNLSTSVLIPF